MSTVLISSDAIALGRRLRRARDRAGISAAVAARRLGWSRQHIDLLERGRDDVSLDTLTTLAQLYNCRLHWLLTGVSDEEAEAGGAAGEELGSSTPD
jgi:transcriptional regulator with XRE-family HTH domain